MTGSVPPDTTMDSSRQWFEKILGRLSFHDLDAARLQSWSNATAELLEHESSLVRTTVLARAWVWSRQLEALASTDRARLPSTLRDLGLVQHLGPGSVGYLLAVQDDPSLALVEIAARETLLDQAAGLKDGSLGDRMIEDTGVAVALLTTLRDEPPTSIGARIRASFPELGALGVSAADETSVEHDPVPRGTPELTLLDDVCERVLARKLAGLEQNNLALFQRDPVLSARAFAEESGALARLREHDLLGCVRCALLYLDFAKGGSPVQRKQWREELGADLSVHNLAARTILETAAVRDFPDRGVLQAFRAFRDRPPLARLVLAIVESHGLCGQAVRGETPLALFAPWVDYLKSETPELAKCLGISPALALELAMSCLHLVNLCDTAAVREGLLTDALREEMLGVEARLAAAVAGIQGKSRQAIARELSDCEEQAWRTHEQNAHWAAHARQRLVDRLSRMRLGRIRAGEPRQETEQAIGSLSEPALKQVHELLKNCQFWYAESATSALTAAAQLKILLWGAQAVAEQLGPAASATTNVSLQSLVSKLHPCMGRAVPYRLRLVETMLSRMTVEEILAGGSRTDQTAPSAVPALGTLAMKVGGQAGVGVTFEETEEAAALLTLLPIYEQRSSTAFHATLKMLCDVYGLRKDEFDRVANEGQYLVHMNSARNDKARMLDHVRSGRIVEVGPGGGVVLDLLAERFPDAEVIGLDVSRMVVEALRARQQREGRRWTIIESDAFRLSDLLGAASVDTVIFCSLLHEIYSYLEYPSDADGQRGRFRLESVRDLLRAAYRTLVPGGRIVIRDGVMPAAGVRMLRFLVPDAREFFLQFANQFEARSVRWESISADCVRLSAADAMEFLYKYTWGPASFPYEIREQYGVLPYDEYRRQILDWLQDENHPPRAISLAPADASYLQPGYVQGLAGKVELLDEQGRPAALPDSNCLLVFEKTAAARPAVTRA